MRLFKTLLHNCLHDLRKNLKQLIAIVFIIGIAVTLFTGLSSNGIEFERRVNSVYSAENGNLADIWVTVNVNFDEKSLDDTANVKKLIGSDGTLETRTLMPASLNDIPVNSLIYIDRPTVNKEYETKYDYTDDNLNKDFFFIDEEMVKKYEAATKNKFSLGDEIPVSFDSSILGTVIDSIVNDYDIIVKSIENYIYDSDLSFEEKVAFIKVIEDNKQIFIDLVQESFDRLLAGESIELPMAVNGVMKHPENIQNGTFSTSNMILSARTLLCSIVDKLAADVSYDSLVEFINQATLPDSIKNELLNNLEGIKEQFNVFLYVYAEQAKEQIISDDNNQYVQYFKEIYNQLIIKVGKNKKVDDVLENIKQYYRETYPDEDKVLAILDANNYPSNAIIQNDIIQSKNLTYCFPLIFFFVAILVVLTTITQMMLKQRIQIGTMKALGVEKKHILLYYLFYMNIVGILGVLLGTLVGPIVISLIMNIKYVTLYQLPALGYSFPWLAFLGSLFGVILLISLITYLVIRQELSYVPSETMRGKSPTIKFKEKKKIKEVKHVSLMMTLRNIKVHTTRSIMVICGVMGCSGLLIAGFGIEDVINYGKDNDLYNYLDCDYVLTYNTGTRKGQLIDQLLTIDEVENVEEYSQLTSTITFKDKNVDVPIFYFSAEAKNFKFDDKCEDGHWDLNGVGLCEVKAKELGVKEGDYIDFVSGGKKYSQMRVEKIFYTFGNNSLFIYHETLPDLSKSSQSAWVNLKKDKYTNEEYETIRSELLAVSGVSSLVSKKDNEKRIEYYMSSVRTMTNTIKIFAILLAVVVLINLAILNFEERSRDIATLRVLGFSRFEIARSLIYEVMILTCIGALLGLTLGLPLEYLVLSTNITPIITWHYIVKLRSYLIGFLISVCTALVVNIAISSRIDKIQMAESLKSIE